MIFTTRVNIFSKHIHIKFILFIDLVHLLGLEVNIFVISLSFKMVMQIIDVLHYLLKTKCIRVLFKACSDPASNLLGIFDFQMYKH